MSRISECVLDPSRLAPVRRCMTKDKGPNPEGHQWAWMSISPEAIAFSCGAIAMEGDEVDHDHDPGELSLCRRLASEAAQVMEGVEIGMGTARPDVFFAPFFVTANRGAAVPAKVTEAVIRRAFGGTLYSDPEMEVVVEPLEMKGRWWTKGLEYLVDNDDALEDREAMADGKQILRKWAKMVKWFGRSGLHGCSFIMIKVRDFPTTSGWDCLDFPYLAVGITDAGSLVGMWGEVCDH